MKVKMTLSMDTLNQMEKFEWHEMKIPFNTLEDIKYLPEARNMLIFEGILNLGDIFDYIVYRARYEQDSDEDLKYGTITVHFKVNPDCDYKNIKEAVYGLERLSGNVLLNEKAKTKAFMMQLADQEYINNLVITEDMMLPNYDDMEI